MGCTVRDKHIKPNRRTQSAKPTTPTTTSDVDHHQEQHQNLIKDRTNSVLESGLKQWSYNMGFNDSINNTSSPNYPIPNAVAHPQNPSFDDCGWSYYTEEELQEFLLKHLETVYNAAVSKLVTLGYEEEVARKAVLRYGHCYGSMDVLSNVLHNSLAYLNSGCCESDSGEDESEIAFKEVKQWQDYSLMAMVTLLQQIHPELSRGHAMWCLLRSDLHEVQPGASEIPVPPSPSNSSGNANCGMDNINTNAASSGISVSPGKCKFHGGWGFGHGSNLEPPGDGFGGVFPYPEESVQREIDCSMSYNLSPSMKSLLKKNVAAFAAGIHAKQKMQMQSKPCTTSAVSGDSSKGITLAASVSGELSEKSPDGNLDVLSSVLFKFRDLTLEEGLERFTEDQKDQIILALMHQVNDLEKQVKERKEWAHQKALQAATKLSNDLTELKLLRMEREETQRLKKGKQTHEDATMKRLSEMENALRKASSQVDRANAAVRELEIENAEIRAEMEAYKLNASESATVLLEVKKREKRCLKRLLAWEKQKTKLQGEIAAEKQKVTDVQQELVRIHAAQKEAEAKLRQEVKEKDQAMGQVEAERRAKETTEGDNKRKLETLRLRLEIDSQRQKDDLQRLEQELSRLQASAESTEQQDSSKILSSGSLQSAKNQGEANSRLLKYLYEPEKETACERKCLICKREEVSVVFLPCAHEVTCANCGEDFGKKGKATCPCCRAPIQKNVRVFGASS